jgi:hypothetical protein
VGQLGDRMEVVWVVKLSRLGTGEALRCFTYVEATFTRSVWAWLYMDLLQRTPGYSVYGACAD